MKVCGQDLEALAWFSSCLPNRSQRVLIDGIVSDSLSLECGVPQGSFLGPLLINICASKLFEVIKRQLPNVHCYADDSQLCLSFKPDSLASQEAAVTVMQNCINDTHRWMLTDRLILNVDKTEFLILSTTEQLCKVTINHLTVGMITFSRYQKLRISVVGLTAS